MTVLDHPREVSVTEAARRGVAGIVADAEAGDIIVTRRNEPVAAVVSIQRLDRLERLIEDVRDLTLALARVATDDGDRVSFDEVLAAYGLTRDDLAAVEDEQDGPAVNG